MIDRSIALLVIGLVFGGGIGFVIAAGNGITLDGHDHSQNLAGHAGSHAGGHNGGHNGGHADGDDSHTILHEQLVSVPPGADAPHLEIALTPDPVSGWNLELITEGFRFSPQNANGPHVPGEGHAHVYVNGVKIARLYGPWMHLDNLPDGPATIRVTLNANDHRALAIGQEPVVAFTTINAN